MARYHWLPAALQVLAVALLILAERILRFSPAYPWLLAVCALLLPLALLLRQGAVLRPWPALRRWFLAGDLALLLAALAYAGSRWLAAAEQPQWATLSLCAALLIGLLAGASLAVQEYAFARFRRSGVIETQRLRQLRDAALIGALALASATLLNYAAGQRDWRHDLSFSAPTQPSETLLRVLREAEQPIELTLFFKARSEVLAQVQDYFDALADAGVQIEQLDQELEFARAKKMKVNRNGTIALRGGERQSHWYLGETYEEARWRIPEMDAALLQRVAKLARGQRTVYITHEHEERPDRAAGPGEPDGAEQFGGVIRALNNKVLYLSPVRLSREVPRDADLVVIHGPRQPFLAEEAESLRRYVAAGGALLLLLDPEYPHGLDALLLDLGLRLDTGVLAHPRDFYRDTHTPADRGFLFSTTFAQHPAIATLADVRRRAALMVRRAGRLLREGDTAAKVTIIAQSRSRTFVDRNSDWEQQEATEPGGVHALVAAVETAPAGGDGARVIVAADADLFDDKLMTSEPNQQFALDALLWLLRDSEANTPVAAPRAANSAIRHTRDQDLWWFYGSTLAAPSLVLLLGWLSLRRRGRRGGA